MNLNLVRDMFRNDGIFGEIRDTEGNLIAMSLEHAYSDYDHGYVPKIPAGVYKCVRGLHELHGMSEKFETFEITGVAAHTGLLFHWGNYNKDSSGCVLVGQAIASDKAQEMLTNSRETFGKFMASQVGVDDFILTVS